MSSHWRIFGTGLAVILAAEFIGSALPAGALQTVIDVTVMTDPEAPYFGDPIDYTIVVEARGGAISDLTVRMEHDCNECAAIGPIEPFGNGDRVLEPGERWQYTAHSDYVFHGLVGVTVTGTDLVGNPVESSALVDYGAPWPFEIEFKASANEVREGDQVTWEILVGNLGSVPIEGVWGEAGVLCEGDAGGGHSRLGDPVVLLGNDDNLLDPEEVWTFSHTASLWCDSLLGVSIVGSLHGGAFGEGYESDIVTVVLPATGFEAAVVAVIGLVSLTLGISLWRHLVSRQAAQNRVDGHSRPARCPPDRWADSSESSKVEVSGERSALASHRPGGPRPRSRSTRPADTCTPRVRSWARGLGLVGPRC